MPKRNGDRQSPTEVQLGVYMNRELRAKGQVAIRILGYDSMTAFIEEKLREAIEQAHRKYLQGQK